MKISYLRLVSWGLRLMRNSACNLLSIWIQGDLSLEVDVYKKRKTSIDSNPKHIIDGADIAVRILLTMGV